jgi:hypothetical protein
MENDSETTYIWVFHGTGASVASGVFDDLTLANHWIQHNRLEGVLTAYPLNRGVYDWAIAEGFFTPKQAYQKTAGFIQKFTSAS